VIYHNTNELLARMDNNPITETFGALPTRTFVIALISSVELLNGSEVRQKEREEAEKYFVRFFAEKCSDKEFVQSNDLQSRLKELSVKWSLSEATNTQQVQKKTIAGKCLDNLLIYIVNNLFRNYISKQCI
jgi:hypothetical protein